MCAAHTGARDSNDVTCSRETGYPETQTPAPRSPVLRSELARGLSLTEKPGPHYSSPRPPQPQGQEQQHFTRGPRSREPYSTSAPWNSFRGWRHLYVAGNDIEPRRLPGLAHAQLESPPSRAPTGFKEPDSHTAQALSRRPAITQDSNWIN